MVEDYRGEEDVHASVELGAGNADVVGVVEGVRGEVSVFVAVGVEGEVCGWVEGKGMEGEVMVRPVVKRRRLAQVFQ